MSLIEQVSDVQKKSAVSFSCSKLTSEVHLDQHLPLHAQIGRRDEHAAGLYRRLGEKGERRTAEFFVESRFHYVIGPDIEPTATQLGTVAATGGSTNGYYYPLTFGFRF